VGGVQQGLALPVRINLLKLINELIKITEKSIEIQG
jgi:hypothetical protein